MFHSHGDEVDEWGGKIAPTLYIDLEYAAALTIQNKKVDMATLKDRASKYVELLTNN